MRRDEPSRFTSWARAVRSPVRWAARVVKRRARRLMAGDLVHATYGALLGRAPDPDDLAHGRQ
ncbi:hypothetical protein, partial [Methylobacterium oxalidis]|uniref:hypothetical protein n=1 Tax=Methylobacterium oxalidis TaxID=944322 RepID=UPI001EDDAAEC